MRGRISYIGKRYSKANNKCMTHDDSNEESKFIVYLDAKQFICLHNESISSSGWI